ncbi:MAG: prevent-host-death protein [Sphingobium sp.]|nr:MAG: prevent-host-death protein [Sphingobium sp.]
MVTVTSLDLEVVAREKQEGAPSAPRRSWRLQDAKAKFSEVVRLARESGPQRVTLHGRDAVVIVSAEAWDRERQQHSGRRLVETLAASPIGDLDLERPVIDGPVRTIDL